LKAVEVAMTENDLLRIEREIKRPLPAAVRRFFLNYPPELRTTTRDMGTDQDGEPYLECAADSELCDAPDGIVALNAPGLTSPRPLDWSPRMLIVGMGGCGEVYWVDLDDERGPVYRFEAGQEAESSDPMADSLEEFAQNLIASYGEG
jgi:hypothetical protein